MVEVPDDLPAQRDIRLATPYNTDHPTAAICGVEDSVPSVGTNVPYSVPLTLDQDDDVEDPSSLLSQSQLIGNIFNDLRRQSLSTRDYPKWNDRGRYLVEIQYQSSEASLG